MKPSPRRGGGGGANLRLPAKGRSGKGRRREEEPLFLDPFIAPISKPLSFDPFFPGTKSTIATTQGGNPLFHSTLRHQRGGGDNLSFLSLSKAMIICPSNKGNRLRQKPKRERERENPQRSNLADERGRGGDVCLFGWEFCASTTYCVLFSAPIRSFRT